MGVYRPVTLASDEWLSEAFITKDFFVTDLLLTSILIFVCSFPYRCPYGCSDYLFFYLAYLKKAVEKH